MAYKLKSMKNPWRKGGAIPAKPRLVDVGVYLLRCGDFPYYKIGITKNIDERIASIQACCPFPILCLVYNKKGDYKVAMAQEAELHAKYDKHNISSEWFELTVSQAADICREITKQ